MASPMRIRATMIKGSTEVKVLMSHPMETVQRKDSSGALVTVHHIKEVIAKHNDKVVLQADWGAAVSQNPFLQFTFNGGAAGDTVSVTWNDNKGETRTDQVALR